MNDPVMDGPVVSNSGAVVVARAASKLTLGLRVLGRRADGFHELEALVVSVNEPHDLIEIRLADGGRGVRLVVENLGSSEQVSTEASTERDRVPTGAANLAVRASEMLLQHMDARDVGVELVLRKGIPVGGGLGGGSADAAAVLVGLRRLLGADSEVDDTTLVNLGAQLGSDVPFCINGGAAWMRGRGELLEPLGDALVDTPVLVITPPFRLATAEVYSAWDRLGGPRSNRALDPPPAMAGLIGELVNDLEPAAEAVEPRLQGFREAIEAASNAPAILAGSGASYAVLPERGSDLAATAARVRAAMPGAAVWCARSGSMILLR